MITISEDNGFLTLINIFTVIPDHQQPLIELLTEAIESSMSEAKGFISSSIHKSVDATKVVLYTQWQSREEYNKRVNDCNTSVYLKEVRAIAGFESEMYNVAKTFVAPMIEPESEMIALPDECGDTLWDNLLE